MITEQYESHSKFIDVMMDAIDEERMAVREEKGSVDKKLAEAIAGLGIKI